jgi:hypothetical protein
MTVEATQQLPTQLHEPAANALDAKGSLCTVRPMQKRPAFVRKRSGPRVGR